MEEGLAEQLEVRRAGVFSKWRRRHCSLKGGMLAICKTEGSPGPEDPVIDVAGCGLRVADGISFVVTPIAKGIGRVTFRAANEASRDKWVEKLLEAKLTKRNGRSAQQTQCTVS